MISSISIFSNLDYKKRYDTLSDEELIREIKDGNDHAERCLYKRYTYIIKRITSSFFLVGGGVDDLFQEAMIGLMKAIEGYNEELGNSFRGFAEVCIRRQVITAIRKTKSYEVLSNIQSVCDYSNIDYEINIGGCYSDLERLNPENVIICKEEIKQYYSVVSEELSEFEKIVLTEYGKGKSYVEISAALNKSIKSVDNALQRAKKKISSNKEKILC
ncbi:sigma-70 family RNA polymerase sigma factor [Sedimentibacter sp.]|uniref:sigma-70 family RNA polymerase sigma factor n=1 Tax=Sedimentibacter sp. TaxID=1960295 RepID=UPI0028B2585C|nr:sigma-70 family RNA polymerase sigma factor [Sedimentibacter sp.]